MCIKFFNDKIKKMDCTDVSLVKVSVIAFTLMVAKLWDGILYLDWYWYLIIAVIIAIKPLVKIFRKK